MAWVAVDKNEKEHVYQSLPIRLIDDEPFGNQWMLSSTSLVTHWVELPKGSIEKLIGKKLTWEDEPVELKEK